MSYAKLSNSGCDAISVSLLSNKKFISPTSSIYGIYPRIRCFKKIDSCENGPFETQIITKKNKKCSNCNPKCLTCPSPCENKSC